MHSRITGVVVSRHETEYGKYVEVRLPDPSDGLSQWKKLPIDAPVGATVVIDIYIETP